MSLAGPRKWPAHGCFRPQPTARGKASRPGSGLRPTVVWPRETEGGDSHDHASALGVAAARHPLAANGHLQPRPGEMEHARVREKMANMVLQRKGREEEWGWRRRARARWLRPWRCARECSIKPYRSKQDGAVARSEERERWRSVACRQSSGGGLPASEHGGGDGDE
jgi:hypothetical protein